MFGRYRPKHRGRTHKSERHLFKGAHLIVFMLIVYFGTIGIRSSLFQVFAVPSASMDPTLVVGDRILVNKTEVFEYKRRDVVVFKDPDNWMQPPPRGKLLRITDSVGLTEAQIYFVKRIIGLPGDHVFCCDERGLIEVNGKPLKQGHHPVGDSASKIPFDVVLPGGKYWVMGDNRSNSADSRAHMNSDTHGYVDVKDLKGRVEMVLFPFSVFQSMK